MRKTLKSTSDLRFSQQWTLRPQPTGMWCHVVCWANA